MTDSNKAIDALLLQPPPGDLTGPYPAMAYLKSRAENDGFKVGTMDLGIDALHYLSHGSRVKALVGLADFFRKKLEAKPSLGPEEQRWYALLVRAMGFGLKPGIAREAIRNFQDREKFYDHFEYKKSCAALDAFYRLLSATHYPSEITPSEYPPARVMGTLDNILAHKEREINPFVDYYFNQLFPAIRSQKPAAVGISMVFGAQSVQGLGLAALVKEHFPEVHVVLGGAYFSQWVMQMEDGLLAAILSFSDSIVCGEGEAPFSDLLRRLKNGESLEGSPNLIFKDSSAKGFRKFETMTYTDVAEQPPPDFSDLDMSKYLAPDLVIPYAISRGCYWGKCVFCQNRYGDHGVRKYQTVPLEKALSEMAELSETYGTPHFNFSNDVIDPAYIKKFSRAVIDSKKTFYWNTDLRAEKQFTPELCKLMADAGLNCVAIGFESACQKVLDLMDKGNRKETTREVFKNLHDAGAATQAMGFFGFPGETEFDGAETVAFLEQNIDRISYYVMGLLMVVPGSRMYENPQEFGVSEINYRGNPLRTPEPVWLSKYRMSPMSVNKLYRRLSTLEARYAIGDYPYVGALSTNHGFLYFKHGGPDILKKLREEERELNHTLYHLLVPHRGHQHGDRYEGQDPDKVVPRWVLPQTFYQSPFPGEKIGWDENAAPAGPQSRGRLFAGPGASVLLDPVNAPFPVTPAEEEFIRKIDGKQSLDSLLFQTQGLNPERVVMFFVRSVSCGAMEID